MAATRLDALELAQALIRCPSVTPEEGGALDVLQSVLDGLGFTCHRLPFAEDDSPRVDNLYARLGDEGPQDRKSPRLHPSHSCASRMPSSALKTKTNRTIK